MKTRLILAIGLATGLALLVLVALTGRPTQAAPSAACHRYVVNPGGADSGNCSSSGGNGACRTIQYALRQAASDETICVADSAFAGPSVYTGTLVITKSVTLDGAWRAACLNPGVCTFTAAACAPENVILDGQGAGRVVHITGKIAPKIQCFTITGGDANGLGGDPDGNDAGGGIYSQDAAPVIVGNVITRNFGCDACTYTYGRGGGIYLLNAPATAVISGNVIDGNAGANTILGWGGGIALRNSSVRVLSNTIQRNLGGTVGDGGGIYVLDGSPTIADNRILTNTAAGVGVAGNGGGIYVESSTPVTIERNLIQSNTALVSAAVGTGYGGGVAISGSLALLQDNRIVQNSAATAGSTTGSGGGIYVYQGASQVRGNHILSNSTGSQGSGIGGGLYAEAARIWLDRNTVLDNRAAGSAYSRGGGVRLSACTAFTLTNNIVARNAVSTTGSGVAIAASTGRMDYNTIADNRTGDGVGVHVQSSSQVTLTNNLIANQAVGISRTSDSFAMAQYTLFDGNGSKYNAGVSSTDEVVGPAALRADYHLQNWSAAIDRATPLAWVTTDVDSDTRPSGAGPDVGADEASCNRYVLSPDGSDGGRDCSDAAHPCRTVQHALDQAADGDVICVADHSLQPGPSVYVGTHTVNKSVTLDGAWQAACVDPSDLTCAFTAVPCAPQNVVLDAQGAGPVVNVNPPGGIVTATVRCFTLTGGRANEGGGIYVNDAVATIASNVITGNAANSYGGGVNVESASAVITANAILSNSATWGGGGIEMTDATVALGNNRIADNRANYGGGIEMYRASVTATANLILRNQSSSAWMVSGSGGYHLFAVNNVVAHNSGGAFRIYNYYASLIHNTIVSNTDSAVQGSYTATLVLTNNVVAYNGGTGIVTSTGASVVATHNLFWHNGSDPYTGSNPVLADPLLAADGYHLLAGSPAIGAGILTWVETDIDGDPRLGAPDLGVDEYVARVYLPLVLRNS